MTLNSARPVLDVILEYFQEEHWHYQVMEKEPVIRAGFRGERGTWVCYARVDEMERRFMFSALMGMNIAPQHRAAVVEYLTRVNYTLPVGHFEMEMDTGDVRFRASVETPDSELSKAMTRRLVQHVLEAMDHYFPGVLAVVHGGLSPEAALARAAAQPVENVFDV